MANSEQARAIIQHIPRLDKLARSPSEIIRINKPYILGAGTQALFYFATTPIDQIRQFFPVNQSLVQFIQQATEQDAFASARRIYSIYPPERKNKWKHFESMLGLYAIGLLSASNISQLIEDKKAAKHLKDFILKVQARMASKDPFVSIKLPPPVVVGYYRVMKHHIPPRPKEKLEGMLFDISNGKPSGPVCQKHEITPARTKRLKEIMQEWKIDHSFLQIDTSTSLPTRLRTRLTHNDIYNKFQNLNITDEELLALKIDIKRNFIWNKKYNGMFKTVKDVIGYKVPYDKLQPILDNPEEPIPYFTFKHKGYAYVYFAIQQTKGKRGEKLIRAIKKGLSSS